MKVQCQSIQQFTECIAAFVREGLTFEADAATLTIKLTGGY